MLTSIEATIDQEGIVKLKEPIRLSHPCKAIVTIMDEAPATEAALLSEATLAQDWDKPEEDAAWSHLQPKR